MTTYHLEYRSPSEGELYLPAALVADCSAITHMAHDDFERPGYVFTEDRPRGEHPEALLIRVNGELYGRTYVPESNEAAYNSMNDIANFQYASDITEWEDVYDEVPDPEPEPERPTADVIRITGIDPSQPRFAAVPVIAIRQHVLDVTWYRTVSGFVVKPELITAWDDIDTNEEN